MVLDRSKDADLIGRRVQIHCDGYLLFDNRIQESNLHAVRKMLEKAKLAKSYAVVTVITSPPGNAVVGHIYAYGCRTGSFAKEFDFAISGTDAECTSYLYSAFGELKKLGYFK